MARPRPGVGWSRTGSVVLPLVVCAWGVIFLVELWSIHQETGTTYNNYFALPAAGLLVFTAAVEVVRSGWRLRREPHDSEEKTPPEASTEASAGGSLLDPGESSGIPPVIFAALLAAYLTLYPRTDFVVLSAAFIVVAIAVLTREQQGSLPRMRHVLIQIAAALVFCLVLRQVATYALGVGVPTWFG